MKQVLHLRTSYTRFSPCFKILNFYVFENVFFLSHLTVNFDSSFNKKKYPLPLPFHQQVVEKVSQNKVQNPSSRTAITAAIIKLKISF